MKDNFEQKILKAISFVPGLAGLASTNFSKSPTILPENKLCDGFSLSATPLGKDVIISAIIVSNIRAKVVVKEISLAITNVFKNNNIKLNNINIFIRGVK